MGYTCSFGAKEQDVMVAPPRSTGQVSKQFFGCRGDAQIQVHVEVAFMGESDHHGPGLLFTQPEARSQLKACERAIT